MNWIQKILNNSHLSPEMMGGVFMLVGCAIVVVVWDWVDDMLKSRKKSKLKGKSL